MSSIAFLYDGPVHNIPESFQRIFAPVLVIKVIGVFPHIECKDRRKTFGQW